MQETNEKDTEQTVMDENSDGELEDELDGDEEEELSVVEKIIGVFISPKKTFNYLADHPDFWWPLIIISLIMIGTSVMIMPKMMPIMQAQAVQGIINNPDMSESQRDETMAMIQKYVPIGAYVQVGLLPLFFAIAWLISTLLVFLTGLVQGLEADFKKLIGVIPWLSFISMISEVGKSIVIFMMSEVPDDLTKNPEIAKPFSAAILLANNPDAPVWLKLFLSSIDPFTIWSVIVMVVALEAANKCTRSQAIVTVAIVTIVGLLIMLGLSFFQGGAVVKAS